MKAFRQRMQRARSLTTTHAAFRRPLRQRHRLRQTVGLLPAMPSITLTAHLKGCIERKVTCAAYAVDDTVVWGKQQVAK